jgi:hypothetical protein
VPSPSHERGRHGGERQQRCDADGGCAGEHDGKATDVMRRTGAQPYMARRLP